MATQNYTINTDSNVLAERVIPAEIGTDIDAGTDVQFVDGSGDATAINYIMVEADGTVEVYPVGDDGTNKYTMYLAKGGWHECPGVTFVYNSSTGNTDASLGIRCRI